MKLLSFTRLCGRGYINICRRNIPGFAKRTLSADATAVVEAWDKVAQKYSVHPETTAATLEFLKRGYQPMTSLDLEGIRRQTEALLTPSVEQPFDGKIEDILIPSQQCKSGIPASVYTPSSVDSVPVILLYIHGGALISGTKDISDGLVKRFSSATNAIIVNIDYRLLPNEEDPFAPFNDSVTAAEWVLASKLRLGGHRTSKTGVIGDSAGGQISCCVTGDVTGFDFQVLIYPVASFDKTATSMEDFRDIPAFSTEDLEYIYSFVLESNPEAVINPRFNPAMKESLDLKRSPPTLILVAELDPLKDGAIAYSEKLKKAGVPTEVVCISGFPHGYMVLPMEFPTGLSQGLENIVRFVKSAQSSEK